MPTQKIKSRFDGRTRYKCKADSLLEAMQKAVKSGADLRGADLQGADLRGAYFRGAYLRGADLWDADLRGAQINWQSHALVAEILLRAAADDVGKRSLAGLILISKDWCWDQFSALDHPDREWALAELRKWVQDSDGAPDILRQTAGEPAP